MKHFQLNGYKMVGVLCAGLVLNACGKDESYPGVVSPPASSTLAQLTEVATLEHCPNGGAILEYGIDVNVNKKLDPEEVTGEKILCHGRDGRDGVTDFNHLANLPDLDVFALLADLAAVATSGDYRDLNNKPDLGLYPLESSLSPVATSGEFLDLSGRPDLTVFALNSSLSSVGITGNYSDLTNVPNLSVYATNGSLHHVARSGSYADLTNVPNLSVFATNASLHNVARSGDYADLANQPDLGVFALSAALHDVAHSGDYSQLVNLPDLSVFASNASLHNIARSGNYAHLTNRPDLSVYATTNSLSSVATSGDYADLLNQPDLSVYVTENALSPVATSGNYLDLLNQPNLSVFATRDSLSAVATSGDYTDLSNRPDLSGFVSHGLLSDVAISGDYSDLSNRPTALPMLSDADGDTVVQVERAAGQNAIHFTAGGTEALFIDDSGFVGLGTTTPTNPLHVSTQVGGANQLNAQQVIINNQWSTNTTDVAQSLVVGSAGWLTQIDINVDSVGPDEFVLSLFDGSGTAGPLLAEQTVSGLSEGWNSIVLTSPVKVAEEQEVTFRILADTEGLVLRFCDGYGGDCYSDGDFYWWNDAGTDETYSLAFKSYVQPEVQRDVVVSNTGRIGVGTSVPTAAVHVSEGDIYIDSIGRGLVMTDSDGGCWRVTVNSDGSFQSASVDCP